MTLRTVEVDDVPCTIRTLIQDRTNLTLTEINQEQVKPDLVVCFKKPVWVELKLVANHPDDDLRQYGYAARIMITELGEGIVHVFTDWTINQENDCFLHPEEYVGIMIEVSEG